MNRKPKILVAEDDTNIREGLLDALTREGYQAHGAVDGSDALKAYTQWQPDLLLLDIMMPKKSGYDVCREIRRGNPQLPILMLTAKGEEIDRVLGLELGADDYVVKPFSLRELLARVAAILRRTHGHEAASEPATAQVHFGEVTVDVPKMRGECAGRSFSLTRQELALLDVFLAHPGEVLARHRLLAAAWGPGRHGYSRTLDQHVAQLRRKIEPAPAQPRHLLTVHGIGYRFEP
jgi:DNA-binding response OmpR family regulator